MTPTLSADFDTRRDAEMTVEHLVQEHGLDRGAITIVAASDRNTSGTRAAGSDTEGGAEKPGTDAEPVLSGRVRVRVEADAQAADQVRRTFATYNGREVET